MDLKSLSKFLSYLLRHRPEAIDLKLDSNGWAKVSELIVKAHQNGKTINRDLLQKIIKDGAKQRFIFSEDGEYIRAGYGHSIDIDLQLHPKSPPPQLYHGTTEGSISSILEEGIKPGNRQFVHLSVEKADAQQVGSRHGSPVILTVQANALNDQGYSFYQSESESTIWLTKSVPPEFVNRSKPDESNLE